LLTADWKGLAMTESYVVENSDPNNFVVTHTGAEGRYVFHVVPVEGGRGLSLAPWNRQDRPDDPSEQVPNAARTFAEREAKRLGLVDD
jgi:hypothetical protein